jgi:transcription antitermination factor NusG
VIAFVRRPEGLGLGATARPPSPEGKDKKKRILKQGESREPAPIMVLPKSADGRQRHVREIDEKLVASREPFYVGCRVRIVDGPHGGMQGHLRSRRFNEAVIQLPSEANVVVPFTHLQQLDELAPFAAPKRRARSRSRSPPPEAKRPRRSPPPPSLVPTWLRPDIRVKICNKMLREGRLYGKVAWVVDVLPGAHCLLRLEDATGGAQLEAAQGDVETVVPKPPGRVRILRGEHAGALGKVVERDSTKQRVHVQLDEDEGEILALAFDDVAQTGRE